LPRSARAACAASAGPVVYFPANGATNVPTDVVPRAFVATAATDPPVGARLAGTAGSVAGAFSVVDDEVRFTPSAALAPSSAYTATFDLAMGGSTPITFQTGAGPDGVPAFAGLASLDWWYYERETPCVAPDSPGFAFTIRFSPAPGPARENVEYWFEQSFGAQRLVRARLRGADLATAPDGLVAAIDVGIADSTTIGRNCFAVHARGASGQLDANLVSICVDLNRGPGFRGICSLGGAAGRRGPPAGVVFAVLALATLVAARRRPARSLSRKQPRIAGFQPSAGPAIRPS